MVGVRDGCQVAFGDGVPLGAWKQGAERRLGVGAERRLGVGGGSGWVLIGAWSNS